MKETKRTKQCWWHYQRGTFFSKWVETPPPHSCRLLFSNDFLFYELQLLTLLLLRIYQSTNEHGSTRRRRKMSMIFVKIQYMLGFVRKTQQPSNQPTYRPTERLNPISFFAIHAPLHWLPCCKVRCVAVELSSSTATVNDGRTPSTYLPTDFRKEYYSGCQQGFHGKPLILLGF